ncbi:hypothetical protein EMGBS8_04490, partial [Verrucomicrobiota bacterium]
MMERNINSLAKMMELFRAPISNRVIKVKSSLPLTKLTVTPKPTAIPTSKRFFGSAEQMDEEVFFLLTARMHANLSDRWRRQDLQRNMLTRRTEQQTYEMVQGSYSSLVTMIGAWTKNNPTSSRALIFGAKVLNDWSDFEYLQELAPVDLPSG